MLGSVFSEQLFKFHLLTANVSFTGLVNWSTRASAKCYVFQTSPPDSRPSTDLNFTTIRDVFRLKYSGSVLTSSTEPR